MKLITSRRVVDMTNFNPGVELDIKVELAEVIGVDAYGSREDLVIKLGTEMLAFVENAAGIKV